MTTRVFSYWRFFTKEGGIAGGWSISKLEKTTEIDEYRGNGGLLIDTHDKHEEALSNWGGGGRGDTCDHGLSGRRPVGVNPHTCQAGK